MTSRIRSRLLLAAAATLAILPAAVGYDRIVFRPQPAGSLTWARASLRTARGDAASAWRIENGRFLLSVTVPANATAVVFVPGLDPASVREGGKPAHSAPDIVFRGVDAGSCVFAIGSGRYEFSAPIVSRRGGSAGAGRQPPAGRPEEGGPS